MTVPMIPLIAGKKGAEGAGKALTGDIYTRSTTHVVGRGRNAREITETWRANPIGIGVGAAALGVAAVCGAATVWALQLRATPTEIERIYGMWIWPDGTEASKELPQDQAGTAPTRITGYVTVWRLYVGGIVPYIVVPEGTPGAVEVSVPQYETASWSVTRTVTETHVGIAQRRGFSVLGGDQDLPEVSDFVWPLLGPTVPLLSLLKK